MDSQQTEILGRNLLITELVRAGVEVALPLRDHGVDLLAYVDIDEQEKGAGSKTKFTAVPIQMKAATATNFSLNKKYERLANLLLVYVWHVGDDKPEFFALTYAQALSVAHASGWTTTASWGKGAYATTRVGKDIRVRLEPYRMYRDRWKRILIDVQR